MMGLGAAEILLVEDNADDAELELRALQKRGIDIAGRVHVARDGEEALTFLFGAGPEGAGAAAANLRIVFLDLKLPKVSGREVLRRLRADERTKLLPVVVFTSSREEADVHQAYLLAANSFIVKPVDFESFLDAVGTLGYYWLVLNQLPVR